MARDNRYLQRPTDKESQDVDKNEILLNILRSEFPDDYLIQRGQLEHDANLETAELVNAPKPIAKATRSSDGIMRMSNSREEYVELTAVKAVPTVDDDELDEIIDEEYEYFLDPDVPVAVIPVTGEFFMKPLSPLNPEDFHDLYIRRGPATIGEREGPLSQIISDTFCVYYIQNSIARPIPNYKTLEVMLVERGLTYSNIKIATPEDVLQFDMELDGNFAGDITADELADPVEEFRFRQMDDRTFQWSERIRFESGYVPGGVFKRDPGDYLKPPNMAGLSKDERAALEEIYINEDPEDRYYDRVFQGQTYKEKLREKFEGKMIIAEWPTADDFNPDITSAFTLNTRFDDLSRNLRMMISGYWKQVTDLNTVSVYAYVNDLDISGKRIYSPENREILIDQFIEEDGAINQLIAAGGVTVLQEIVEDAENIPVWNDFPHIAEFDALDKLEYEEYIDNFANPFDIEYLKPYEPAGSIKYYNQAKVLELQEQAQAQARLNEIKEALLELTTNIGPRIAEMNQLLLLGDDVDSAYVQRELGVDADIYQILDSVDKYVWLKKRNNGKIKLKSQKNLFIDLVAKAGVKNTMSDSKRNRVEEISDALGQRYYLNSNTNVREYGGGKQIPNAVQQDVYEGIDLAFTYDDLYARADDVSDDLGTARSNLNELNQVLLEVDTVLTDSTDATEVDNVYSTISDLLDELANVEDILNEASSIKQGVNTVRRQYINECYNFVQSVRQSVYNNNQKYAIKWSEEAKNIINAYIPGKNFTNYLPDGVE